jgi:hypothetical protein
LVNLVDRHALLSQLADKRCIERLGLSVLGESRLRVVSIDDPLKIGRYVVPHAGIRDQP